MSNTQLQYLGFSTTPLLWNGILENLSQFEYQNSMLLSFKKTLPEKLMLGKRAEEFVFFDFENNQDISNVYKNIQINQDKLTIGELDAIFNYKKQTLHLEVVYKFYLYDDRLANNEIDCLIGPNRKDSLREKLDKLKDKQLPLLHHPVTKKYLSKKDITTLAIKQKVYFKAQVFLPANQQSFKFSKLNNKCIYGFYYTLKQIELLKEAKFYIPQKIDWMVNPYQQVNWLSFNEFITLIKEQLEQKRAPMCWVKKQNGELHKFFVVWW